MCPDPDLVERTRAEEEAPLPDESLEPVPQYELPSPEETEAALNKLDQETADRIRALGREMTPPHKPAEGGQAEMTLQEIIRRFTYYAPTGDQPARYVELREAARDLAIKICTLTPTCREQSIALTKLEECIFFSNAAIARRT
jgi:hypothetical protein